MSTAATFLDLFDRTPDLVRDAVGDRTVDQLATPPAPGANPIVWLVWHLTRVQDDHVAGAAAALGMADHAEQAWTAEGWYDRFALPFGPAEHGYGMDADDVAHVRASGELLLGYHDAVHARTRAFLDAVQEHDWDRIVDEEWDPPVTLRVRLASVVGDVHQHLGQAAYVSGLAERSVGG